MEQLADLTERKQELESYFKSVNELNTLPYSENAVSLWMEYSEHGNYPHGGGYYDQPLTWRNDMAYIGAEMDYAGIADDIQEAQAELAAIGQR
jgi:hypothetical protein